MSKECRAGSHPSPVHQPEQQAKRRYKRLTPAEWAEGCALYGTGAGAAKAEVEATAIAMRYPIAERIRETKDSAYADAVLIQATSGNTLSATRWVGRAATPCRGLHCMREGLLFYFGVYSRGGET